MLVLESAWPIHGFPMQPRTKQSTMTQVYIRLLLPRTGRSQQQLPVFLL